MFNLITYLKDYGMSNKNPFSDRVREIIPYLAGLALIIVCLLGITMIVVLLKLAK